MSSPVTSGTVYHAVLVFDATYFHDGPGPGTTGYHYTGTLDGAALYPTALTDTQITNHWTTGGT